MHKRNTDIVRRSRRLQKGVMGNGPVVYWMSRDQRGNDNWALLAAQQEANVHNTGMIVVFCLDRNRPDMNGSQTNFMEEGLSVIQHELDKLKINWVILHEAPEKCLPKFLHELDTKLLICDFDPLTPHRRQQAGLITSLTIPFYEVDSHNIIPAWIVSEKKEYGAYTIRPKIKRLLDDYLTDIPPLKTQPVQLHEKELQYLQQFQSVELYQSSSKTGLRAGELEANRAARDFIQKQLSKYDQDRNNPCLDGQSGLSPYLHFGHLSPQRLAWIVKTEQLPPEVTEPFLEELIVRRELSDNFCLYEKNYDNFDGFTEWAKKTLDIHRNDKREYTYSFAELEEGHTHETLWNCCQLDLVQGGKLHGFLRMYWAKKILEWTHDPETAQSHALTLNDRYSLDGNDPNGYAGVAWSIGGVHDRAWGERPVFGKIRYMNEAGCRRKFDVKRYIHSVLSNKD